MAGGNDTVGAVPETGVAAPVAARPHMPGYGIAVEAEGMLPWAWAEAQLAAARNYWICTTRPDGRPHAAPVWGVWLDGAVHFGSGARSAKARNLAANPNVVVHLESGDDVVILEGVAEVLRADAEPARFAGVADAYGAKYPGFRPDGADPFYVVRPQLAFAWEEKSYPKSATRFRFTT